ncbi:hypothetical protein [Anaerobaca lacustris]|uniref:Uncharacterized protein n=1 Tax=Anaerobaca lacustris TaxID=3044600 RepID=A0AAW6U4J2_9BACT|nr:hypothetical protein [Sedimentisphaerales bacterium M17dextr]
MATRTTDPATAALAAATANRAETATGMRSLLLDVHAFEAPGWVDEAVTLIITFKILDFMGLGVLALLTSIDVSQDAHIFCPLFTTVC